jgi:hypothetical protein
LLELGQQIKGAAGFKAYATAHAASAWRWMPMRRVIDELRRAWFG